MAFFGTGGTEVQMASLVPLPKYRPGCVDRMLLFTMHQDRVYKIVRSAVPFANALAAARQSSLPTAGGRISVGHLVTLGSRSEEAVISMLANGSTCWLGATDAQSENVWLWQSGCAHEVGLGDRSARLDAAARRPGYENWAEGEPNDANRNEDCVRAVSSAGLSSGLIGNWVDVSCTDSVMYIVEYEPTIMCIPEQTPAPTAAGSGGSAAPTALPPQPDCQCRDGTSSCTFDTFGSKWCYIDSVDVCTDSLVARGGVWSEAACDEHTVAPSVAPTAKWQHYAGMRYMFSSTPLTCAEAQSTWQSFADGATLAKIGSAEEQEFVTSVLLAGNTDFNAWIGCNDLVDHGNHVWFDGTACSSSPMNVLQVTAGGEHCSVSDNCATDGTGNHGSSEACTIAIRAAGTLTATQFDVEYHISCSYDWLQVGDERFCGSTGPRDVRVQAGDTIVWESDSFVTLAGWTICLTALDNDDEDAPIVYSRWHHHEPSGGEEHCAHLWHDHSMNRNDAPCTSSLGFICSTSTTTSPTATSPTEPPTEAPTLVPTLAPTSVPTAVPTLNPTAGPTEHPTRSPTSGPTLAPTTYPTLAPTWSPTSDPPLAPTSDPTMAPTVSPTIVMFPTIAVPTTSPTTAPSTTNPTALATATDPSDCVSDRVSDRISDHNGAYRCPQFRSRPHAQRLFRPHPNLLLLPLAPPVKQSPRSSAGWGGHKTTIRGWQQLSSP